MTLDELSTQLAACGAHLDARGWSDFLASPPDVQARIVDTMMSAAVRPGPDYLAAVLGVLKIAGTVVGVAGGIESGVALIQNAAKL